MAKNPKLEHINRSLADDERKQADMIREEVQQEFPPIVAEEVPAPAGMPAQIQTARRLRRLTRYELGESAGVPSTVVGGIEKGEDVPLSQFNAVVTAVGLTIELVEHN